MKSNKKISRVTQPQPTPAPVIEPKPVSQPPATSKLQTIPIAQITQDDRVRMRVLNPETVKEYARLLQQGTVPPPAKFGQIAGRVVMVDGHHWMEAKHLTGGTTVDGLFITDRYAEAMTIAFFANMTSRRPLTVDEQRSGIRKIVTELHLWELSDEELAKRLYGCLTPSMIGLYRSEFRRPASASTPPHEPVAQNATGRKIATSPCRVGKPKRSARKPGSRAAEQSLSGQSPPVATTPEPRCESQPAAMCPTPTQADLQGKNSPWMQLANQVATCEELLLDTGLLSEPVAPAHRSTVQRIIALLQATSAILKKNLAESGN